MHKRIPVAEITLDDDTAAILNADVVLAPAHLPIGISANDRENLKSKLNRWWKRRSIPASRSGLREALEELHIPGVPFLLRECYGLSLSDQYWIHPQEGSLTWDSINFFDNPFSEDIGNILFGGKISDRKPNLLSPDSTSDGQLKKRWKIIDNTRYLIKGGSRPFYQEPLNEVIAANILARLHIPHASYELLWDDNLPYSICADFIHRNTELVSAFQICETLPLQEDVDLYQHYLLCCDELGIPGVRNSLNRMLAFDYLISNSDRHFGNFGAIRDAETLEWIGSAPLFDNGTSLWCGTVNSFINPEADTESVTFRQHHNSQLDLITTFGWFDTTALSDIEKDFNSILSTSPYMDNERKSYLCHALRRRIELFAEYIEKSS